MNKIVSSLCAFALVVGLAAACTDSSRDRLGEKQGDGTPSTAQPAVPSDTGGASATNPGSGSGNRTN